MTGGWEESARRLGELLGGMYADTAAAELADEVAVWAHVRDQLVEVELQAMIISESLRGQ